ncbi:LysR family transcriptional regulator [Aeromonas sp. SCS5]|uniref:LysR family transcriptional regulator n=1 Tax=Aeromonas sp. SCS5 TaxID=1519205 RepID=UPI0009042C6C|nr:LysR family transcriptional regulator [Aeromonas sp. SCS5]
MSEPWRRLPALSLKQIQYFVTLAQLRHFTETANQMAISQPALSSALRQIESVLGGKLFHRTAQAVTLTEQGEAILPHAKGLLNVAHAAFADMQQVMAEGGDGTLRIGLIPSACTLMFPLAAARLQQQFPGLRVEFQDHTNDGLLQALAEGSLDAGIGVLDGELPGSLEVTPLLDDALVAVINRQDPLAAAEAISWQALTRRDIALFARGNVSRQVNGLAQSQLPGLKPRYTTDYVETLYGLVRSGLAVAILPGLYAANQCDPQLKVVALHEPVLSRTLALMWAKGLSRSTRIDEGRALLRQVIMAQYAASSSR